MWVLIGSVQVAGVAVVTGANVGIGLGGAALGLTVAAAEQFPGFGSRIAALLFVEFHGGGQEPLPGTSAEGVPSAGNC